jgi:hypothetical protein
MENNGQEKTAITWALENYYFKGIYEGNLDLLNQIYYKGTLLFGDVKGQPYAKTLTNTWTVSRTGKAKRLRKAIQSEIISISVVNSIAIAE